jgi:hypothetical protein
LIDVVDVDEIAAIPEVTFIPTVELSRLLFVPTGTDSTPGAAAIEIAESITAEEVSISLKTGTEVEPAGASINAVVRVIESPFAPKNDIDTVAEVAV